MANVFARTLLGIVAASIAAGALAAQDPETLFAEGVKALRLGQKEDALAKLREVLAADPSHEQAFEIWRKTDQDIWRWLTLEQGDIQKIAQELQSRARLRRKEMSRDEGQIDALVNSAVTGADYGDRRKAISSLVTDHGEFAVPALVKKLGDGSDTDVQNNAILALFGLGTVATLPLIDALGSEDAGVRRNVAAALSHIKDPRAPPALLALAANDSSEQVRYVANSAVKGMGAVGRSAVESYLELANNYLTGRAAGQPSEVVWGLADGNLVPTEVPSHLFNLRIAQKLAHAAWRTDPASAAAKSAYAQAILAEAAAIAATPDSSDELKSRQADLRIKSLAFGPTVLRSALADARGKGMAPVAVEAARLLGGVEDAASLASSTLVAALDDADKRVAYAAGLAMVQAAGGGPLPAAARVVKVLGNAASEETLRTILVVDSSEVARKTAMEAFSSGRGTVVEAAARGLSAVGSLFNFPNVDVVVINQDLSDVVPEHVIGLIRKDERLANTKVVVIATDTDAASQRFGDKIDGVIKGPITGESLAAKVNEVLDGVELDAKRLWADNTAGMASQALASLSAHGVDVSAAAPNLGKQLNRADSVSVPAAKALAVCGSAEEVPALVDAVTGAGSNDLKVAAARSLGAVLQRCGGAPADVVEKLTAALAGADVELRSAIVGALGRAGLASGDQLKLMDALNGKTSPDGE